MKIEKILLTSLWLCTLFLAWCGTKNVWDVEINWFDLKSEEGRIAACEERAWFYLNFNEWSFTWENEEESEDNFVRNGRVHYTKWWETADRDVSCLINVANSDIVVEFLDWNTKIYCTDGEKQADACNMVYDPVCGDDDKTYWNSCVACSSKNIDYYTPWECQSDDEAE